jgi:3',5'-cyclic AMP phosphodiesterase CpdA
VTVQLLHTGDLHFGGLADLRQIEALEAMLSDLRPDAVIVAGDLTQRARHGEFQRARAFVRAAQAAAPTLVIPGNHDVQWWWRPLLPVGRAVLTAKYRRYFGDDLAPTLSIPGAVIASVHTSHGVAWGSLTTRLRDLAVKGHLPQAEALRAKQVFAGAPGEAARVLVVHHNVLRGDLSQRMGLARWRQAQRRLAETGADVILCGHDHQEGADVMGHKVVVSTCGTLCRRSRGGRPQSFNVVTIDPHAVQVTFFRWEAERGRFRSSDTFAFAREAYVVRREGMVAGRAG